MTVVEARRGPLTKRMREALNMALSVMSDQIYDDIDEFRGDPVTPTNVDQWLQLARFPIVTWRESRDWRRKLARAADDLANDLDAGELPEPRCPAEEAVLWIAMREDAPAIADSQKWRISEERWVDAQEDLVQDWDIAALWNPQFEGLEEPDDPTNIWLGMGDYRPVSWFAWFANKEPRDPKRGYRR
jgi:hypothetical protein